MTVNHDSVLAYQPSLHLAVQAARAGAEAIWGLADSGRSVTRSEGRDVGARGDTEADRAIRAALAASPWPIVSEESPPDPPHPEGWWWAIDPLDGTYNHVRGLPLSAVSVGLWHGAEPRVGVIIDLASRTTTSGLVGSGAWVDGRPIRVSDVERPQDAALATGLPIARSFESDSLRELAQALGAFRKVRMLGSAALSIRAVAEGVLDAYWEQGIFLWDVGAGLALVAAAGGRVRVDPIPGTWSAEVRADNGVLRWPGDADGV
jgi:myo-inositol-1(or 4)-monophosphatase